MHQNRDKKYTKGVYVKPKLRIIELMAEEVLATGCKMDSPGQTNVGDSLTCGIGNNCSQAGS